MSRTSTVAGSKGRARGRSVLVEGVIEVPRVLPRGRHKLDPQLVAASQRARLLEAMKELVAEKGYVAVTIGDIAARAGTAKRTFYEHFADKLQCFLATLDAITRTLVEASARFFRTRGSILARCEAALRGFLELLASMPDTARVFYIEAVAAGPEAAERRLALHEMFAGNMVLLSREAQALRPGVRVLSDVHALAVVGALHELIYRTIHQRGAEGLREIGDELVPLAVAFLNVQPAAAGVVKKPPAERFAKAAANDAVEAPLSRAAADRQLAAQSSPSPS
jgi:AcrR family transcriptional regulator